jgi:hypothetical protein
MKTMKNTIVIALTMMAFFTANLSAQEKGNGKVINEERKLSEFTGLKANCAFNIFVSQGQDQMVKIETDENLMSKVVTEVHSGTIEVSCKSIGKATKLNVYITSPKLVRIESDGAANIRSENTLTGPQFTVIAGGASKLNLNLDAEGKIDYKVREAAVATIKAKAVEINSETSGAANLKVSGTTAKHAFKAGGASNIKAFELVTDETTGELSGAANAQVLARKKLNADLSGASNLSFYDNGKVKKVNGPGEVHISFEGMDNIQSVAPAFADSIDRAKGEHKIIISTPKNSDSMTVRIDDKKIVVINDDGVEVNIGNKDLHIGDNGVKLKSNKKAHFNGHWSGVEIGVNGFLNSSGGLSLPQVYDFLDLRYNKSVNVNVNFFEQNFNIASNHLGLTTGLGISWNNYRFSNDVYLDKSTGNMLTGGYQDDSRNYQKSKLVASYLNVPLLLEYQTNSKSRSNSFHITGGIVGGLRLGSHTKVKVDDGKSKVRNDFFLSPFKVDAIAKIGWGVCNLYGTYSLTEMFRSGKGPVLYPFSVGICLTDFSN